MAQAGSWTAGSWAAGTSGLKLIGDGSDKPQLFKIGNRTLAYGISLAHIKAGPM